MGDRAPPEEESGGEGWIVSFADLMTLLFAAFVVLYGLKPEGESKDILGVTSSIREAFIEIPDEIPEEEKEGPVLKGKFVLNYFKADQLHKPILKRFRRSENVINVINKDMQQVKDLIKLMQDNRQVQQSGGGKQDDVSVHQDADGFRVRFLSSFMYESGSYRVHRKAIPALDQVGRLLKDLDRRITIEGHTDSTPPRGEMTNWDLSALRATHVLRHLVNKNGFPAHMISAAGYGDTKAVSQNQTAEGRRLNRRVELKVHYDDVADSQ